MVTLEHTNEILKDVEVMTDLAAKRSKDVDNIITNVSETVSDISETISENKNAVSIICLLYTSCRVSADPHERRNDLGAVSTIDSVKL